MHFLYEHASLIMESNFKTFPLNKSNKQRGEKTEGIIIGMLNNL